MPRSGGAIQPAILPGSVGEVGGHEKRQPVVHGLVEGAQDARLVGVTAVAHQQLLGFLAAVAAKVRVQQVSHGPEVAALFHIDLDRCSRSKCTRACEPLQANATPKRRAPVFGFSDVALATSKATSSSVFINPS